MSARLSLRTRRGGGFHPIPAALIGTAFAMPLGASVALAQAPAPPGEATPSAAPEAPRRDPGTLPAPAGAAAPAEPSPAPARPEAAAETASETANATETGPESTPDDEVVVLVERIKRVPGSVHVIGKETLERYNYDDPHATLQLVPGVYVRTEDGFGLRPNIGIRGAISDRSAKVALMEDGVLFGPAPYSAPAAYYFPIITRMTELQVIKGPAAIEYGPQTVGGAIDLTTRALPTRQTGGLDLAVGQYAYGKAHGWFGTGDGVNAFLIEGIHLRTDGFKELPSGDETGFYRNELMFKAAHEFAPGSDLRHRLSLKLTYSEEQSDETYLGLSDEDFAQNPLRRYAASDQDRMKWHRTSAVVTHEIEPRYWLSITTQAYRHDLSRRWSKANHFGGASLFDVLSDPAPENQPFRAVLEGTANSASPAEQLYVGPNQRDFVSQGVQSRAEATGNTGPLSHRAAAGLRFHYDRIERLHTENVFDLVNGNLAATATPTITTTSNQAETYAVAGFVRDEIGWGGLTLTPGIRLELIHSRLEDKLAGSDESRTLAVPLPGIGAYYSLTDDLGVLAGVHRGMSPPPAGTDSDPEISINYEAGVRFASGTRRAEVIGYYNDYQNLTSICTLSSGCEDANLDRQFEAGRARIYGLEALLDDELRFGGVRIPISASYTLTLTEFLETFASQDVIFGEVEAGDELPYVPRHEGRASVGLELERAGGYVAGNYAGQMRELSGSGPLDLALATDAQFTVDLGLHYQLLPGLRLYGQVRNVFDELYIASRRPYGARPNAPRWVQVGAQLEF
jgi:Fe(3+) dicitrate transport protein